MILKKPQIRLAVVSRAASDTQREMLPLFKTAVHLQNIFFLPAAPLTERNKTLSFTDSIVIMCSISWEAAEMALQISKYCPRSEDKQSSVEYYTTFAFFFFLENRHLTWYKQWMKSLQC